ncbi:MAG: hypothetical protein AAB719_00090 [Patescibacteria group bacterium]
MLTPIKPFTEDEKKFVAGALAAANRGELGELLELKMSQNGQDVEFEAECRTKDGRAISVRGTYDGSWDSYDCAPLEH